MSNVARRGLALAIIMVAAAVAQPGVVLAQDGGWKVGFVNIQRILEGSRIGRAASADLERARNQAAERLERSLERLRAKEAEAAGLSDPMDRRTAEKSLREAWRKHDELAGELQLGMEEEDRRLVSMVLSQANEVLAEIAQKGGFALVLKDPEAVGWLAPRADLTDRVIREMDRRVDGSP